MWQSSPRKRSRWIPTKSARLEMTSCQKLDNEEEKRICLSFFLRDDEMEELFRYYMGIHVPDDKNKLKKYTDWKWDKKISVNIITIRWEKFVTRARLNRFWGTPSLTLTILTSRRQFRIALFQLWDTSHAHFRFKKKKKNNPCDPNAKGFKPKRMEIKAKRVRCDIPPIS